MLFGDVVTSTSPGRRAEAPAGPTRSAVPWTVSTSSSPALRRTGAVACQLLVAGAIPGPGQAPPRLHPSGSAPVTESPASNASTRSSSTSARGRPALSIKWSTEQRLMWVERQSYQRLGYASHLAESASNRQELAQLKMRARISSSRNGGLRRLQLPTYVAGARTPPQRHRSPQQGIVGSVEILADDLPRLVVGSLDIGQLIGRESGNTKSDLDEFELQLTLGDPTTSSWLQLLRIFRKAEPQSRQTKVFSFCRSFPYQRAASRLASMARHQRASKASDWVAWCFNDRLLLSSCEVPTCRWVTPCGLG